MPGKKPRRKQAPREEPEPEEAQPRSREAVIAQWLERQPLARQQAFASVQEQLDERIQLLEQRCAQDCREIDKELAIQLIRIPREVKDMGFVDFYEQYGQDLQCDYLQRYVKHLGLSGAEGISAAAKPTMALPVTVLRTVRHGRTQQLVSAATPGPPPPLRGPDPSKGTRVAREGETVYMVAFSQNGSPLDGTLEGQAPGEAPGGPGMVLHTTLRNGSVFRTPAVRPRA